MSQESPKNGQRSSNSGPSGTEYHERSVFPAGTLGEIEQAFVATLWHHPDLLPETQRWLVPEVHLSSPKLRILLAAIAETYALCNATDWVSVLACITELGHLKECGDRAGLDEVYSCRFYEPLFPLYAQELQRAGLKRANDNGQIVEPAFFSGGIGRLERNKLARNDRSPAWVGRARIMGKNYLIRAYLNPATETVDLKFDPQ